MDVVETLERLGLKKDRINDVTFASEEYINERTEYYVQKILEDTRVACSDTINDARGIEVQTAARESVIKELAESADYTPDNILVIRDPYGYVPLSAMAVFSSEKPLRAKVWVEGSKDTLVSGELPPTTKHFIPIMGLYAEKVNDIRIELYNGRKRVKRIHLQIETGALPVSLQNLCKVLVKDNEPAYPFYYISGVDVWFPTVIDSEGNVRYYIRKPSKNYGVFPLSQGYLIHCERNISRPSFGVPHASVAYEMDLWGRVRKTINIKNGIHHDVYEIGPGGNLLITTSTLVKYCEDAVAEVDRATGKIIKVLGMDDVITEPSVKDSSDWAHMNTVSFNRQDNTVLVCLRNLHSVLKIDWSTNELIWILGDPYFWKGTTMEKYVLTPEHEDIKWFYQAHASYQLERKLGDDPEVSRIMIYDNHYQSRRQTDNFDNDENSYGNIYFVNEKTKTVRLHKRFESRKSTVRSNAVYSREKDRFLMMSGVLDKKYKKNEALIYDYTYSDGSLNYMLGIRNKFYRAYPFSFEYYPLAERIRTNPVYAGEYSYPVECDGIDVTNALKIEFGPEHEDVIQEERKMKTRKEKEAEWEKLMAGKVWEELDHTERIAKTSFKLNGKTLLMYGIDHIVNQLYFVGENHTYVYDNTDTKQDLLAIFYNYGYHMSVGIDTLKKDRYHLYIRCMGNLYDTGKDFEIKD